MPKDRVLYAETYRKDSARIKAHLLPEFHHIPPDCDFQVSEVFITKAGRIERNGQTLEFQDLRVYLKPKE